MPGLDLKENPARTLSKSQWERIGVKRRAGALIPLFSIYSKKSIGVGDLGDLKLSIDWIRSIGHSIIQLLPLNEVGAFFCPYDPVSSFALEPLYLSFDREFFLGIRGFEPRISNLRKKFPLDAKFVDYALKDEKLRLLRDYFLKQSPLGNRDLEIFKEENSYWLPDFALYRVIKARQGEKPWYEWEDNLRDRDRKALSDFSREHKQEIEFQYWLQWQLYRQLKGIKDYAARKGVLLKGDLPLLVSRDSADVWAHPEFFKLEFAAGAPPDMYCANGQRWGMPPYNWENIASDDYRYLKEKLKYADNFYDLLRVDHVVGLFCIWMIPESEPFNNQGIKGFFDPPDAASWEKQGRQILKVLIDNTDMLLCAEDLGLTPEICPQVINDLGIPGNDVQRWAKDWSGSRDFISGEKYRFLSVAMLSTPDTANWPRWWENEAGAGEKEELWKMLGLPGGVRERSDQELVNAALGICYSSRAIFCINNIFDLFFLDDIISNDPHRYRINRPGTISDKNWSLRLPIPLEELLHSKINTKMRRLSESSGRI